MAMPMKPLNLQQMLKCGRLQKFCEVACTDQRISKNVLLMTFSENTTTNVKINLLIFDFNGVYGCPETLGQFHL
jgi:hypothetical protein